jgi:hypothetical protein
MEQALEALLDTEIATNGDEDDDKDDEDDGEDDDNNGMCTYLNVNVSNTCIRG